MTDDTDDEKSGEGEALPGGRGPRRGRRDADKKAFASRLLALISERNMYPAEVARRAGLTRDALSTYTTGRSFPTPLSLKKLAKALGVAESELMPERATEDLDRAPSAVSMKISQTNPEVAWLFVDKIVPTELALEIVKMVTKNATSEGS